MGCLLLPYGFELALPDEGMRDLDYVPGLYVSETALVTAPGGFRIIAPIKPLSECVRQDP